MVKYRSSDSNPSLFSVLIYVTPIIYSDVDSAMCGICLRVLTYVCCTFGHLCSVVASRFWWVLSVRWEIFNKNMKFDSNYVKTSRQIGPIMALLLTNSLTLDQPNYHMTNRLAINFHGNCGQWQIPLRATWNSATKLVNRAPDQFIFLSRVLKPRKKVDFLELR